MTHGESRVRCPKPLISLALVVVWPSRLSGRGAIRVHLPVVGDHRSTASYRRHSIDVLARRLLRRAFAVAGTEQVPA